MDSFPNSDTILCVDGDILQYEFGFGLQDVQDWFIVEKSLNAFFQRLQEKFGTYNVEVYLTGEGNFREEVAVTYEYKGNRPKTKPKWYKEIKEFLIDEWDAYVVDGMEADDMLSIRITEDKNCICVSRDKDLKQVPGWHYSWPTSRCPERKLELVDEYGYLELTDKRKLVGGGAMFLYAQCLMGDITDNIRGIPGLGDVGTYELLKDCKTEKELYETVTLQYYEQEEWKYMPEVAYDGFLENMNLLYMVRELDEEGNPVMWRKPE